MTHTDLLSVFRRKFKDQDSTGFNYFDFLHAQGSPFNALFYSQLFWPEFVEIDGMVFLQDIIEDSEAKQRLNEALNRYKGDKTKTEQSFNLVEIPSLFGKHISEITDEEDAFLADRLAEMWRCRLATVFPDRGFLIKTLSAKETGGEIAVVFHTIRSDSRN
jgi:hypothetical protein